MDKVNTLAYSAVVAATKAGWMTLLLAGLITGAAFAGTNALPEPAREGPGPAGNVPSGERKGFRRGLAPRNEGLAGELGLSEDKAKEIKNRMHETRKIMIKLKADRDLAKADLEHLLTADTLDEKAIMEAADKLAQVNAEMTKAQVKARLAISATLTPEQRSRLHELRQGMMQRFKERREGFREQRREQRMERGDRPEDAPEPPGGAPEPDDKAF